MCAIAGSDRCAILRPQGTSSGGPDWARSQTQCHTLPQKTPQRAPVTFLQTYTARVRCVQLDSSRDDRELNFEQFVRLYMECKAQNTLTLEAAVAVMQKRCGTALSYGLLS